MTATEIQSAIITGKFTDRELRDINGTIVDRAVSRHEGEVERSQGIPDGNYRPSQSNPMRGGYRRIS